MLEQRKTNGNHAETTQNKRKLTLNHPKQTETMLERRKTNHISLESIVKCRILSVPAGQRSAMRKCIFVPQTSNKHMVD